MAELAPHLSVVVASYNQRELVSALVDQLLAQEYDANRYEVIVSDDASHDGTVEMLSAKRDSRLRFTTHPSNSGRAATRNRGIRMASGDVVIMLDGDHDVHSDFLRWHARAHAGMQCAVVGRSVYPSGAEYGSLHAYLSGCGAAKRPQGARLPGRYFVTCNCSVPRQLLMRLGLFDERFSTWGGEDLDLGMRLERSDIPIISEPRALAIHHHPCTLSERLDRVFGFGYSSIPLLLDTYPELLYELRLDRIVSMAGRRSVVDSTKRALMRLALGDVPYQVMRRLASSSRRWNPPRFVFDYLHYRQYARGYLRYSAEKGATER